jgi:hypothetical protein
MSRTSTHHDPRELRRRRALALDTAGWLQADIAAALGVSKGAVSPTQRTLQALRREGYLAAVAEKWNPHSRTRSDLFGFADVLAVRAGAPVLAVQATSASNHSARVRKAQALPAVQTWLAAGCAFEVWRWAKRKGRWAVRRQALGLADLGAAG